MSEPYEEQFVARNKALRNLPSVTRVSGTPRARELTGLIGEKALTLLVKAELEALRDSILNAEDLSGAEASTSATMEAAVLKGVEIAARAYSAPARNCINATGVLLHTNLGRAPLGETVVAHILASAEYTAVQMDLESNRRCRRDTLIEKLLTELVGSEASTVLNNNAAATFILLKALASGKEVIVSRGQLVEIGGSYRMPDVMAESGAILREVGTTNKTHLSDYENAISEETGAVLFVEPSNYVVEGFSSFPGIAELASVCRPAGVPLIADIGSGALRDLQQYGINEVTCLSDALRQGADVTCSSGDKMLGGPQAGIICGSRSILEKVRKSPFARMFRVDKLTLAGIEATLLEFAAGRQDSTIPLYAMLSKTLSELRKKAESIAQQLGSENDLLVEVVETSAFVGGGSLPGERIPSISLKLSLKPSELDLSQFARLLRVGKKSVFCRLKENAALFDMRTVLAGQESALLGEIKAAMVQVRKSSSGSNGIAEDSSRQRDGS